MLRPTKDQYFLMLAVATAARATCAGKRVGCLLVDEDDRIIATGYNGVPSGLVHCSESPCPGVEQGTGLYSKCQAIHAEQNAVARCLRPHAVVTAYCTLSPCTECAKLLLATSCRRVIFCEEHPASTPEARDLWKQAGGVWLHGSVSNQDVRSWMNVG